MLFVWVLGYPTVFSIGGWHTGWAVPVLYAAGTFALGMLMALNDDLQALHEHGEALRQEARDAADAAHAELEAERQAAAPERTPSGLAAPGDS